MTGTDPTPVQEMETLLKELLREVRKLKSGYQDLQAENDRLRKEISEAKSGPAASLLGNGSAERLALRQQIMGLIEKIDKHLPGGTP